MLLKKFTHRSRIGLSEGTKKKMFEYPRAAPNGEQMGFVEVMGLNDDGLIQFHRDSEVSKY